MLKVADILFYVIHLALIISCLGGWAVPRVRTAHRYLMATILSSWFLLGLKFGIGYCVLTDWHWQIKDKLGQSDLPNSFIKHILDQVLPFGISNRAVDILTLVAFYGALLATIVVWWGDRRRARQSIPPVD